MSGGNRNAEKKYKAIAEWMRRSGTGRESDDEADMPADFPYFCVLDAVMDGRAAVVHIRLLDSAASFSPATAGAEGEMSAEDMTTEAVGQPTTPGPAVSSQSTTPGPAASSQSTTPGPVVCSEPTIPGPAVSSRSTTLALQSAAVP